MKISDFFKHFNAHANFRVYKCNIIMIRKIKKYLHNIGLTVFVLNRDGLNFAITIATSPDKR